MRKLVLFGTVLFMWGCVSQFGEWKKVKDISVEPLLEFPVVDSRVRFDDFDDEIPQFEIAPREDGTLTLYHSSELIRAVAGEYFLAPTTENVTKSYGGFDSQGNGDFGTLSQTFSSEVLLVNPSNTKDSLDWVRLHSGTFVIDANSNFPADVSFRIISDAMTLSGPTSLDYSDNINVGFNQYNIDLTDAILSLTGKNLDKTNTLPFTMEITITSNGTPVTSLNKVDFSFRIENPVWQMLYGVIGTRVFEAGNGSENVDVFGNIGNFDFGLTDPSVGIVVSNSFGINFQATINQFDIVDRNSNTYNMDSLVTNSPFLINGPTFEQLGQTVSTPLILTKDNSKLPEIISGIPQEFVFNAEVSHELEFEPGTGRGIRSFVLDTSKFVVTGKAELPLYGYVNNLSFTKEFDFNGTHLSELHDIVLEVTTLNKYPVEVAIVLEFYDASDGWLLTLLDDDPIITSSPPLDATGKTTAIQEEITPIELTEETINILVDAKRIKLQITMNTGDGTTTPVRFTDEDYIDIHIGLKGRVAL